jgi:hypothetical protein
MTLTETQPVTVEAKQDPAAEVETPVLATAETAEAGKEAGAVAEAGKEAGAVAEAGKEAGAVAEAGKEAGAVAEAELYTGLFPKDCKHTAQEMVLLANPELETSVLQVEHFLKVEEFATEAFLRATELQRTAMRFRMFNGANEADARTSVAKSQGIDIALLFGVSSEDKAIATVLFDKKDRKRKDPDA